MKQTHKTLPNNGQIVQDNMINEIKNDLNTHEENFEKVQDNFIKINDEIYQMQNNQAIFNDMIKTLKNLEKLLPKKNFCDILHCVKCRKMYLYLQIHINS